MALLPPPPVAPDSVNSRQHRAAIATTVNALRQKLWAPNSVSKTTSAGDTSTTINCNGNTVLLVGMIAVSAGITSFTLKRGTTSLGTFNTVPSSTVPIVFMDAPGAGPFTYSTTSSGTTAATLNAVELK